MYSSKKAKELILLFLFFSLFISKNGAFLWYFALLNDHVLNVTRLIDGPKNDPRYVYNI